MEIIGAKNKKIGSSWQLLILFAVLSLLLLTLWFREGESGPLHSVRNGFSFVRTPIARVGSIIGVPFNAIGNAFTNATASQEDLTTLQEQNAELLATVMKLEEYRLENERLNALLELKDAYNMEAVGARVIGRSSDSWNQVIVIDKGTKDGIGAGMPVMDANGLIGQVESAGPLSSTVRLITDEQSGVAAMIQSSRVEGILSGSINGLLYLNYIPVTTTVNVGDIIITSGIGGIYPKGIAIGEVVSVEATAEDLYHTIVVMPISSSENFEEVLVLTGNETELTYTAPTTAADTSVGTGAAETEGEGGE